MSPLSVAPVGEGAFSMDPQSASAAREQPTPLAEPLPARGNRSAPSLEPFRHYLTLLARAQVDPRTADKVDLSGIIQQTFLEAHRQWSQFRGTNEPQTAAWLRQILAHNLADALRGLG